MPLFVHEKILRGTPHGCNCWYGKRITRAHWRWHDGLQKALEETAGDIEGAIELMRKNGQAKAAKKAGRIAAEGTVITRVGNGYAVAIEFNCETDFVGRDASFLAFSNAAADLAHANKLFTVEELSAAKLGDATVEEARATLVTKIG